MEHKTYEYEHYEIARKNYLTELNELGKSGWQLVSIRPAKDKHYIVCVFMREVE